MYETVNSIILIVFVVTLFLILIRLGKRLYDYYQAAVRPPLLALRDIALIAGLAFPFVLILGARAGGWIPVVTGQVWWALLTGVPAILAVVQFLYIEWRIIERITDDEILEYLKRARESNEEMAHVVDELEERHIETVVKSERDSEKQEVD
jgi:hypothetical protein